MLGLEIRILLSKGKRREFLHTFDLLSKPINQANGCDGVFLFENTSEENRFLWVEHWADVKALNKHLESDLFHTLLGAVDVLGKHEKLYMVEFREPPDNLKMISTVK
jgi:quinol monooxygenase YgiN